MSAFAFSESPGAWERHIIRRAKFPAYFYHSRRPTAHELITAQQRDQQELGQFNQQLAGLVTECSNLADDSSALHVNAIKDNLDRCYDTACGLGAELSEQKGALVMLNDIITTAVRRAHRDDDENGRLLLIKRESVRMRHLTRLNYPIVCDLLREVSSVPAADKPAALLSETDEAFTVALEVLDDPQRRKLADGIKLIEDNISDSSLQFRLDRKHSLLKKQLNLIRQQDDTVAG